MVNKVNVGGAIAYGANMLGFIAVFALLSGLFVYIGVSTLSGSPLMYAVSMFAASLIFLAGFAGMLYKIVADGVAAGNADDE